MANNSVATGNAAILSISASEIGHDNNGNWSDIQWELRLIENGGSNSAWSGNAIGATVYAEFNRTGGAQIWGGGFTYDFRPGGNQQQVIASGITRVGHRADGTTDIYFEGTMNSTGTISVGGPTTVGVWVPWTRTQVTPGTPFSIGATRVSDSAINLTWSQSSPANGQPNANTVQRRINGGPWSTLVSMGATNYASLPTSPNQKTEFRVNASNDSATSEWSQPSNVVFTTPAEPTNPRATKNSSLDIVVQWQNNVSYGEHTHEVYHGVVGANGSVAWEGNGVSLPAGQESWTHVAPNAGQVHIYRIRSAGGGIGSGYAITPAVQLLAAPNKPNVGLLPQYVDKSLVLPLSWQHNPVDSTGQTAYEMQFSTDNGANWTSTGKVNTSDNTRNIGVGYAGNTALTTRVRTWGQATTGGSDGTGASPLSDNRTVVFKTKPNTAVESPTNGSTLTESVIRVSTGYNQPEGASYVKSQIRIINNGNLVEERETTVRLGAQMGTVAQNGQTYTVQVRAQDSNGLWSDWAQGSFNVVYLSPVLPTVTTEFLPANGWAQINLSIPAPGNGQAAANRVTIDRMVDGGPVENIVREYAVQAEMSFIDTTPTVNGTNTYLIYTASAQGSQSGITVYLVTNELRRAYLSKGNTFDAVAVFGANISIDESLSVASDSIQAAGRQKPVGLYGVEQSVQLKVQSFIFEGFGSSITHIRNVLLLPGKACYRDAAGRRVFGSVQGSLSYKKFNRGDLSFTITETS